MALRRVKAGPLGPTYVPAIEELVHPVHPPELLVEVRREEGPCRHVVPLVHGRRDDDVLVGQETAGGETAVDGPKRGTDRWVALAAPHLKEVARGSVMPLEHALGRVWGECGENVGSMMYLEHALGRVWHRVSEEVRNELVV